MDADIPRRSSGMTPAHRELVLTLPQIAVRNYLNEIETALECMDEAAHEQRR